MQSIQPRSDGQFEFELEDGRTIVASDRASLQHYVMRRAQQQIKPAQFLADWKRAVRLAGPQWFLGTPERLDSATDKEQLRPDWDLITDHSGALSGGERAFLYAVCSFYNHEWAGELFAAHNETGTLGELAARLDNERLQMLMDLTFSYCGW